MRIAVDAMGGDYAPKAVVAGVIEARKGLSGVDQIILVGDESAIKKEFQSHAVIPAGIDIFHASETVGMGESPAIAIRRKKDSSIGRAVDLVKEGRVDAMVSAGNTGAVVVAATLKLRTLSGIERPAIAAVMPAMGKPFVLIDAGGNTDCTPHMLVQFAVMGSIYSREILGQANPVVGLMSVGTEESKGNEITKEAFQLMGESGLNFKGNIEGHDLFEGNIDVAVCDGFVGNVILKTSESVAHVVTSWIKMEVKRNPIRILGALMMKGVFRSLKKKLDPALHGGAPLLGVNGICIISHGASNAEAIYHAIRVARDSALHGVNARITQAIGGAV